MNEPIAPNALLGPAPREALPPAGHHLGDLVCRHCQKSVAPIVDAGRGAMVRAWRPEQFQGWHAKKNEYGRQPELGYLAVWPIDADSEGDLILHCGRCRPAVDVRFSLAATSAAVAKYRATGRRVRVLSTSRDS